MSAAESTRPAITGYSVRACHLHRCFGAGSRAGPLRPDAADPARYRWIPLVSGPIPDVGPEPTESGCWHRLLPQPYGSEGLVAIEEDADAGDLATGEVVDGRRGYVARGRVVAQSAADGNGRKPARSPAQGNPQEDEDARRTDGLRALDRQSKIGSPVLEVGEEASYRLRSFIDAVHGGPGRA